MKIAIAISFLAIGMIIGLALCGMGAKKPTIIHATHVQNPECKDGLMY